MKIINSQIIANKTAVDSIWHIYLTLWYYLFNSPNLPALSYDEIRALWKNASGGKLERVKPSSLLKQHQKGPLDVYIFHARAADLYIVIWCSLKSQAFFVDDVYSCDQFKLWDERVLKKHARFFSSI